MSWGTGKYKTYEYNPFMKDLFFKQGNKSERTVENSITEIVSEETGERLDLILETSQKYKFSDLEIFTKLYRRKVYQTLFRMKRPALSIYAYVQHHMKKDCDIIDLRPKVIMPICGISNKMNYHRGIIELIEQEILSKSAFQHQYFINPLIMYNGDRKILQEQFLKRMNLFQQDRKLLESKTSEQNNDFLMG